MTMKSKKSIIALLFLIVIIVVVLLVGDFMALTDIHDDYASGELLELLKVDTSVFPDWTEGKLEWTFLTISMIAKLFLMGVNFLLLRKLLKLEKS